MKRKHKVRVLSDDVLVTMMRDKRYLDAIDCMKTTRQKMDGLKGCGSCNIKLRKARTGLMTDLKMCMTKLSGDTLNMVKTALNTEKIEIKVRVGKGDATFTL